MIVSLFLASHDPSVPSYPVKVLPALNIISPVLVCPSFNQSYYYPTTCLDNFNSSSSVPITSSSSSNTGTVTGLVSAAKGKRGDVPLLLGDFLNV